MNFSKKWIYFNLLILIVFVILLYFIRDNILIWIGFYVFGCSLFTLLLIDGDTNPDKNKKEHKILRKIDEDNGIFEYTETGFYIWDNDLINKFEWNDIIRITVQNVSIFDDFQTELLIESMFDKTIISDKEHGWEKFLIQINKNLNIQYKSWTVNLFALRSNKPIIIYQKYGFS